MNFKICCVVIALVALMVIAGTCASAAPQSDLARIGLASLGSPKQVIVSSTSDLRIVKTESGDALVDGSAKSATIDAASKGLELTTTGSPSDSGESVTISPVDPEAALSVDTPAHSARKYRGSIEVSLAKGVLRLVNVLDVEDYLLGVIPSEMPSEFPQESLKAQAIAARTYFYANRHKHASLGYNLCDNTDCQMYMGVQAEKAKSNDAVKETSGQVLVYGGRPAAVFYSTDCGGITRNYAETRPDFDAPYLCSVTEPGDIHHTTWEHNYKLADLEKLLVSSGIKTAAGLKSISVAKTDSAGWAADISITGAETKIIPAGRLKTILGPSIKSLCFAIEPQGTDSVAIKGKGCGHGWGMCQIGAKALAMPPHNLTHEEILAHYFPGTQIEGGVKPEIACADVAMIAGDGNGPIVLPIPDSKASKPMETKDSLRDLKLPKKCDNHPRAPFDVRLEEP